MERGERYNRSDGQRRGTKRSSRSRDDRHDEDDSASSGSYGRDRKCTSDGRSHGREDSHYRRHRDNRDRNGRKRRRNDLSANSRSDSSSHFDDYSSQSSRSILSTGRGPPQKDYPKRRERAGPRNRGREVSMSTATIARDRAEEALLSRDVDRKRNHESRTVFVYQLNSKCTERDVALLLSEAGKVRSVSFVKDRGSNTHKGTALVEFYYADDIQKAVGLAGRLLHGVPVLVRGPKQKASMGDAGKASKEACKTEDKADRNRHLALSDIPLPPVPSKIQEPSAPLSKAAVELAHAKIAELNEQAQALGPTAAGIRSETEYTRLYFGSLPFAATEDQLKDIFLQFGDIISIQIHRDSQGLSRGFGFLQFKDHDSAAVCLKQMNGYVFLGRPIKVSLASENCTEIPLQGSAPAQSEKEIGDLLECNEGLAMNSSARLRLMVQLARSDPTMVPSQPIYDNRSKLLIVQLPSRCLLLQNMFDPTRETDPDFDLEIANDVQTECSARYGELLHLSVDKRSFGNVYLMFREKPSAIRARTILSGRLFGGMTVQVHFLDEAAYKHHFVISI